MVLSFSDLIVASTAPQLSWPSTDEQRGLEDGDRIFQARHGVVIGEIAGDAADEQIAAAAVERVFGSNTGIAQLKMAA